MNKELEKLLKHITDIKDPFLNMYIPNIDDLNNLINHKVWIRIRTNVDNDYHYDEERIYTIKDIINNELMVNNYDNEEEILLIDNIIGIEDLNTNYNEEKIDFNKYLHKAVLITNHYNNKVYCIIEDIDEDCITFGVLLKENNYSEDLIYPKNLIRTIIEL